MNKKVSSSSLIIIVSATLLMHSVSLGSDSKWNPWAVGAAVGSCAVAGFGLWRYVKRARTNRVTLRKNSIEENSASVGSLAGGLDPRLLQLNISAPEQPVEYGLK